MDGNETPKPMGRVIRFDEARIRDHLGAMVRGTVEEALDAMPKPTACAAQDGASEPKAARTPGREAMNARRTPGLAR